MLVVCDCGVSVRVPRFPFYCTCGKVYRSSLTPTDEGPFQLHWRRLHQFPFGPHWDRGYAWYEAWRAGIPRLCNCAEDWATIEQVSPPDFSSRSAFFARSVENHNRVNARLGKPIVTVEDAYSLNLIFPSGKYRRSDDRISVGFLSLVAGNFGGTETWHRTMIPAVQQWANVTGWGINEIRDQKPITSSPVEISWRACQSVVDQSDVAIVWGMELAPLANGSTKIIAVDHGDVLAGWFMGIIARQAEYVDHAVAINADVAALGRSKMDKPVTHIPNAVDPGRTVPTTDVRARYDWLDGKKVALWAARGSEEKQPQLAMDAARYLPDDWVLVMAGERGATSGKLKYVGPIENPGDWLAVADVFLSTSYWEGFGLSIGEAMLAGVPVAATPRGLGAVPGIVTGFPVDARPDEVARAIVEAYEGRTTEVARAYIKANHSVELVSERWRALVEQVLG